MSHLLFDLDGTLTDPAPGILASFRHAADVLGVAAHGDFRRFIGPPLRDCFAELLGTRDAARVEQAVTIYRERYGTVGLFENAVYDGVPTMLQAAREHGYTLRVVTSKAKVYADRIVDHFGLREHLPLVYGPELGGALSDKGDLLELVLRAEGIAPAQACMIGDREHDVLGARRNAIASVGVLWGYGAEGELRAAGADRVVATLADLLPAVAVLAAVHSSG